MKFSGPASQLVRAGDSVLGDQSGHFDQGAAKAP